jgi:hypothetical protein
VSPPCSGPPTRVEWTRFEAARRAISQQFGNSVPAQGLLLVPLDNRRGPHLRVVRILAELAPRTPLTQEIPALIELDLNLFEPDLIVIRQLTLPVKVLLFVHEAFDLPED